MNLMEIKIPNAIILETKVPLEHRNYYYIYNRGNNRIDLFLETENYYHFLRLYA